MSDFSLDSAEEKHPQSLNWRNAAVCFHSCGIPPQDSICQLVDSDPCSLTDPRVVPWHSSVDAILPVLGTLFPPADDACQEPSAFVIGGMWSPTVPLAWVHLFILEAGTEHKACDVVPAALFTRGALHVGDLQLLKLGGLAAKELYPSPSAHQRSPGLPQQILCKVFGAQADGTPLIGQFHWTGKLQ